MNGAVTLVVFEMDGHQMSLHVSVVERVIHSAEITVLPQAPDVVMGVINIAGQIVPVFNLRKRFHLRERDIDPEDQFIVAHTSHRRVVLPVDRVVGVTNCRAEEVEASMEILPGIEQIEGAVRREDGIILIQDLEKFLSIQEEAALSRVVN